MRNSNKMFKSDAAKTGIFRLVRRPIVMIANSGQKASVYNAISNEEIKI